MTRYIKIRSRENKNKWIKYHIIKNCSCDKGILSIKIDNEMKRFFLDLNEYTKYKLKNILDFKRKYSFRLYDFIKQYQKLKERKIYIEELREFLDIPNNEYKMYHQFKQRILIPSQKEIIEKADLVFEMEEIKEGRKTVAIKFIIKKNNKNLNNIDIDNIKENKIEPKKEDIEKIISSYKSLYHGELDYNNTKNLIELKGIDCVEKCISEIKHYVVKINQAKFYDFTKRYGTEEAYTKLANYGNNKPIQSTNYEQRKYDDDFFNSLYDNVKFIK